MPERRRPLLAIAIVCATVLLSACAETTTETGDGPGAAQAIDGDWILIEGTVDAEPVVAVDGYPITVEIAGDRIGGSAGCNSYGGSFTIEGTTLTLIDVGITEMACVDPGPMEVESKYIQGFWRADSIERTGDTLVIAADAVEFRYAAVAPIPPSDLIGTEWTLDTFIDGGAASSTIGGVGPARLLLQADGTFAASTGCPRAIDGSYRVDGERLLLSFETDDHGCKPPADEQDRLVLAVLMNPMSVQILEKRLTLSVDDGTGLSYRDVVE